jgi:cysteine/O-acetylserine efflux protein
MPTQELIVPFISYALMMIFTPGPNNLLASVLGLQQGYKRTLPCLAGMAFGFLVIMLCGGLLTDFFTRNYNAIAPYLKWTGVAYMVWLAVSLFLPSRKTSGPTSVVGFFGGFALQFLNPKGILFGITIYTSFTSLLVGDLTRTVGSALGLSLVGFIALSTWALTGSALSRWFANPRFKLAFNGVMVVLLAYSVWSILAH